MISVVLPVYNGEPYVKEAIYSILNQQETDFELIIINDGSTDGTETSILAFSDSRIKYYSQSHLGVSAARNLGLQMAQGQWIAWQDADDIALPNRLSIQKHYFEDSEVGYVYTDVLYIDENSLPIGYGHASQVQKEHFLRFYLREGISFPPNTMMVRKEALNHLQFDLEMNIGEDGDLVRLFALKWRGVHVAEPLLLYRRHANSSLRRFKKDDNRFFHLLKFVQSYPIEVLVPEAFWHDTEKSLNQAIAYALMYYLLAKRRIPADKIQPWIDQAKQKANQVQGVLAFIEALQALAEADFDRSLVLFNQSDPIYLDLIYNYIGEALFGLNQYAEAYFYFLQALQITPHYYDPLYNLRLIGVVKNIYKS